jgi:hypothetical protein
MDARFVFSVLFSVTLRQATYAPSSLHDACFLQWVADSRGRTQLVLQEGETVMSSTRRIQAVGLLVLVTAAGPALAQSAPSVAPGTRIRVAGPFIQSETGSLLSYGYDTVKYVRSGSADTASVATSDTARLDISNGWHHHLLHDMAMGAAGGLVVGGIVAAATYQKPDCPSNSGGGWNFCGMGDVGGAGGNAAVGGILGAGGGALIGAVVGLATRSERWRPVSLDSPSTSRNRRPGSRRHRHGSAAGNVNTVAPMCSHG